MCMRGGCHARYGPNDARACPPLPPSSPHSHTPPAPLAAPLPHTQIAGVLRVILSPIEEELPFLTGVTLALLDRPYLDFDIR